MSFFISLHLILLISIKTFNVTGLKFSPTKTNTPLETINYFVQISMPRSTHGLHVESRTPKLKVHIHTLNFNEFDLILLEMEIKLGVKLFKYL
jgi:hypothetical protein